MAVLPNAQSMREVGFIGVTLPASRTQPSSSQEPQPAKREHVKRPLRLKWFGLERRSHFKLAARSESDFSIIDFSPDGKSVLLAHDYDEEEYPAI